MIDLVTFCELKLGNKFVVADIALWISKNCGFFHCIYARTCGSAEEPSGKRDAEEGSAKYKK